MTDQPYMAEPWYALLRAACQRENGRAVAARLGVSDATVSQVLNGTGLYGTGQASTAKFGEKVTHKFGAYECPHLTEMYGEPRVIQAAECRSYAHRPAPIGSTGQLNHWRTCNACPHKALSAPAAPREPKPRKKAATAPATPATTPAATPTAQETTP